MSKEKKIIAAKKAFEYVEEGMKLGLGTGSTADEFTKILSENVKDGFEIICIPTSENTKKLAESLKIPLGNLEDYNILDITIDGADEIDDSLSLLKGGGGALLREKIIAFNSKKMIVIADDSKKVSKLGDFKLPIEVIAFEHDTTIKRVLEKLEVIGYSGTASLRVLNDLPFQTDSKNLIYDLSIGLIKEPSDIDNLLNSIPGVVENGLFVDMANIVILGEENGDKITPICNFGKVIPKTGTGVVDVIVKETGWGYKPWPNGDDSVIYITIFISVHSWICVSAQNLHLSPNNHEDLK